MSDTSQSVTVAKNTILELRNGLLDVAGGIDRAMKAAISSQMPWLWDKAIEYCLRDGLLLQGTFRAAIDTSVPKEIIYSLTNGGVYSIAVSLELTRLVGYPEIIKYGESLNPRALYFLSRGEASQDITASLFARAAKQIPFFTSARFTSSRVEESSNTVAVVLEGQSIDRLRPLGGSNARDDAMDAQVMGLSALETLRDAPEDARRGQAPPFKTASIEEFVNGIEL